MTARAPYPFPANRLAQQVRAAADYTLRGYLSTEGREDLRTLYWLMGDLASDIDAASRDALLYELGRTA